MIRSSRGSDRPCTPGYPPPPHNVTAMLSREEDRSGSPLSATSRPPLLCVTTLGHGSLRPAHSATGSAGLLTLSPLAQPTPCGTHSFSGAVSSGFALFTGVYLQAWSPGIYLPLGMTPSRSIPGARRGGVSSYMMAEQ